MKETTICELCGEPICPECGGCACDDNLCSCDLTGTDEDDE
jgi:hypothetical protein